MYAIVSLKSLEDPDYWYSHYHLAFVFVDYELAKQRCDDMNSNYLFPVYRVVNISFEDL